MRTKRKKIAPYVILVVLAILFALPLLWLFLCSFDLNGSSSLKWPTWTLQNYKEVIISDANRRAFLNGLIISLFESIIVVLVAILASYPLSRYKLAYKKPLMNVILFMTALPTTALMVPLYKYYRTLGLYDTTFGVIMFLSAAALPYAVWMMKNFMDAVPINLEEAAKIDGANTLGTLFKIILPLMMPGVLTVFIYTFSQSWGNFFVPYILLQSSDKMPAAVQLYQFFGSNGTIVYGELAAYSALYALPAIILYVISQKWMSNGFALSGADKG